MTVLQKLRSAVSTYKAQQRDKHIAALPRNTQGTDILAGHTVIFNDAPSYLQQRNEIFYRGIYHFKTNNPSPRILDCGGNIGLSSIYFRQQYPNARITVFEPDPAIAKICAHNIAAFGYSNEIELVEKAVWSKEEILFFEAKGAASGRLGNADSAPNMLKISAVPLLSYINQEAEIDMIKIDIEGAEIEVLESVAGQLGHVKNMFIEYHSFSDKPQKLTHILEIITQAGFRYYLESEIKISEQPLYQQNTIDGFDSMVLIFAYRSQLIS